MPMNALANEPLDENIGLSQNAIANSRKATARMTRHFRTLILDRKTH
jgi:hypothetical protein